MTNATDHADASVANRTRLSALKVAELQELALSLGIVGASKRRKGELVELISAHQDGDVTADASAEASASAAVLEAPVSDVPSFDEAPTADAPFEAPAPTTDAPFEAPAAPVDE
ncbi:Rho termination factor N-terminal domain-containing protein, partial [Agromyces humi]|uniref:Rho termination factor N-terminal domain-containing protein n=1 Tax=Agromyces humi TaxID=1766800 RepID=UPI001F48CBEC